MFIVAAKNKMLGAVADTLNQDIKPSPLIGNERAKQARFSSAKTTEESHNIQAQNINCAQNQGNLKFKIYHIKQGNLLGHNSNS